MLLDEIGKSFLDRAVELVKSGYRFVFVLDNIDWEEKVHDMRKDNQNTSVHAVATSIVFNRIPNEDLPDSEPQQDLRKCNVNQLVKVTASEMECIRKRYRSFVQDILFEQFPFFNSFKSSLPNNATYCRYSDEMATKSETITMPVLMKDEKKYAECVDVLDKSGHTRYTLLLDCTNQVDQPCIQFLPHPNLPLLMAHPNLPFLIQLLTCLNLPLLHQSLLPLNLHCNNTLDPTNLHHIFLLLHLMKTHWVELEFLVLVTSSQGFVLLVQKIFVLVAILLDNAWTICIHFA